MKVQIKIPSVEASLHDDQGTLIFSYSVSNYELMADAKGLIEAGIRFKQDLEAKLSELDLDAVAAQLKPKPHLHAVPDPTPA